VGFALLLLIAVSIYIWRRKKAGKGILPIKVEPPRPAHEIALEELNALKESRLRNEGKIKEFYIQLSEIIRRYIEGRYFIVALEHTTFELIEELKGSEVDPADVNMIHEFLEICDLVKFAKYLPKSKETEDTLDRAFELIERTKLIYDIPLESDAQNSKSGGQHESGSDKKDEVVTENIKESE
jgi:hypothetical protein